MADFKDIENEVIRLTAYIDGSISVISHTSDNLQKYANTTLQDFILGLEIKDGKIDPNQNYIKRLLGVEKKIKDAIAGKSFQGSISSFLADLGNIQQRTISLHRKINGLEKDIKALDGAKKMVYDQAKSVFNEDSIAQNYLQPVKTLVARQVLTNATIKQTLSLIDKWDTGELTSGRLNKGLPAPNFSRYAVQMARDSAYSMNRTTNEIIANELGLDGFVYAGNIISDTRPLCRYLVNLNREIALKEMPPIIAKYPEGLYPGTTKDNFMQTCGGYGCRHTALGVKLKKVS